MDGHTGVIQGALNIIQGIIKAAIALVTGDWKGFGDALKQIAEGAFQLIGGIIDGAMEEAKAVFSMAVDAIIGIANSLGANISEGLGDGIKNAAGAVLDAIMSVVDDAFQWAMEYLGIASPSRKAAQVLGEPIAMGVAQGIRNAIRYVQESANELGEKALEKLQSFADKAADLVSKLMDSGLKGKSSLARTKIDFMDAGDQIDAELVGKHNQVASGVTVAFDILSNQLFDARRRH